MTPMMLLLAFPVMVIIASKIWNAKNFSWSEAGAQALLSVILLVGGFQAGKHLEMQSVEFWTGTVISKNHEDGHYTTTYDCNCTTDSKGNRSCSTCYEDNYTRDWFLDSSIGRITTSNIDTTSRMRRNAFKSDSHWDDAYKGEACSKTNSYTNYVAAANSSLHHREGSNETWAKAGLLPAYPQLHGIYHLNRVTDLGVGIKNIGAWQTHLNEYMGTLGGLKQINIMVYFVPTTDSSYRHALEAHWRGANKNDTIVLIGMEDDRKTISWVDTITWAKSSMYAITIREEIMKLATIGPESYEPVLKVVNLATLKHYERRPMIEFEALASEIDPPTWVMVILIILAIPGSLALAWFFHHFDLDAWLQSQFGRSFRRNRGNRYRR